MRSFLATGLSYVSEARLLVLSYSRIYYPIRSMPVYEPFSTTRFIGTGPADQSIPSRLLLAICLRLLGIRLANTQLTSVIKNRSSSYAQLGTISGFIWFTYYSAAPGFIFHVYPILCIHQVGRLETQVSRSYSQMRRELVTVATGDDCPLIHDGVNHHN